MNRDRDPVGTKLLATGTIDELTQIGIERIETNSVVLLNQASFEALSGSKARKGKRYLLSIGYQCKEIAFVTRSDGVGEWQFLLDPKGKSGKFFVHEFSGAGDFPYMTALPGTLGP